MIKLWLNWRNLLAVAAIAIVSGTIIYSHYLSKKIALQEKLKVEDWVEAQRTIAREASGASLNLAAKISSDNKDIPIIETDEHDNINPVNSINLDEEKIKADSNYLKDQLKIFKRQHQPIILKLSDTPYLVNKYYYGESALQREVRYYPIIQLIIVSLFIAVIIFAQRTSHRNTANQLWAGMAKETAHQLGTPVSSLQGWIEMLKNVQENEAIVPEIEKDVNRLLLITDRFGKIGSKPHLEKNDIIEQVQTMVDYMRKRAGSKVKFIVQKNGNNSLPVLVSAPLFDWVIENLLKNALDAMDGKGTVTIAFFKEATQTIIDISDTGKGILKQHISKVFKPGFTTKKRGWGLGLTLTRRIVQQYHKGKIYIRQSEVGKGTTFRIELNNA